MFDLGDLSGRNKICIRICQNRYGENLTFEIFEEIARLLEVKFNHQLYGIYISYPFIVIPFLLGNKRAAKAVIEWIKRVNRSVMENKISKYHSVVKYGNLLDFNNEVIGTGNDYGHLTNFIKKCNTENGWDLFESFTDVINTSADVYNTLL